MIVDIQTLSIDDHGRCDAQPAIPWTGFPKLFDKGPVYKRAPSEVFIANSTLGIRVES